MLRFATFLILELSSADHQVRSNKYQQILTNINSPFCHQLDLWCALEDGLEHQGCHLLKKIFVFKIMNSEFLCSKFWEKKFPVLEFLKKDSCVQNSEKYSYFQNSEEKKILVFEFLKKDSCVQNSKKYSCVQNWLERFLNQFYLFSLSCASNMDFHDILN